MNERDFTTLALCAFRYALDRKTGISYEISTIIARYASYILPWAREQMIRDISRKANAEGFEFVENLQDWMDLKEKLENREEKND